MERMRRRLQQSSAQWGDVPTRASSDSTPQTASAGPSRQQRTPSQPSAAQAPPASLVDYDTDEADCSECSQCLSHHRRGTSEASDMPNRVSTKDWSFTKLLEAGPRFEAVRRIGADAPPDELNETIEQCEKGGIPLIVEGWQKLPSWPEIFTPEWLLENGDKDITVRNCVTFRDKKMPMEEFLRKSRECSIFREDADTERLYGKDAKCPPAWEKWIQGDKSPLPRQLLFDSPDNFLASDVETLMCYFGIGDTFTVAHKDLCASSGHNLMCYTEKGGSAYWYLTENSAAPDAAAYFQKLGFELDHESTVVTTEQFANAPFKVYVAEQNVGDLVLVPRRSVHQVINYGGLTVKASWSRMTVEGLVTAFHHELPVYRRVCRPETYRIKANVHRGLIDSTTYMDKLKYRITKLQNDNRTSSDLVAAFNGIADKDEGSSDRGQRSPASSPIMRSDPIPPLTSSRSFLGRPSLRDLSPAEKLKELEQRQKLRGSQLRSLLHTFDKILREEFAGSKQTNIALYRQPQFDGGHFVQPGLTCDFCGADIFQSFFDCKGCAAGDKEQESIIICPGCFVEGRACKCGVMKPKLLRPFEDLCDEREKARRSLRDAGCDPMKLKLENIGHLPLFEGALAVHAARAEYRIKVDAKKRSEAACRPKAGEASHPVRSFTGLNCKKCHSSKCFLHLVLGGTHSSEALVATAFNDGHVHYHQYHVGRRNDFENLKNAALAKEKDGSFCDARIVGVLAAQRYTACFPVQRDRVSIGWYDDKFYHEQTDEYLELSNPHALFNEAEAPDGLFASPSRSDRNADPERPSSRASIVTHASRSSSTMASVDVPQLTAAERNRYKSQSESQLALSPASFDAPAERERAGSSSAMRADGPSRRLIKRPRRYDDFVEDSSSLSPAPEETQRKEESASTRRIHKRPRRVSSPDIPDVPIAVPEERVQVQAQSSSQAREDIMSKRIPKKAGPLQLATSQQVSEQSSSTRVPAPKKVRRPAPDSEEEEDMDVSNSDAETPEPARSSMNRAAPSQASAEIREERLQVGPPPPPKSGIMTIRIPKKKRTLPDTVGADDHENVADMEIENSDDDSRSRRPITLQIGPPRTASRIRTDEVPAQPPAQPVENPMTRRIPKKSKPAPERQQVRPEVINVDVEGPSDSEDDRPLQRAAVIVPRRDFSEESWSNYPAAGFPGPSASGAGPSIFNRRAEKSIASEQFTVITQSPPSKSPNANKKRRVYDVASKNTIYIGHAGQQTKFGPPPRSLKQTAVSGVRSASSSVVVSDSSSDTRTAPPVQASTSKRPLAFVYPDAEGEPLPSTYDNDIINQLLRENRELRARVDRLEDQVNEQARETERRLQDQINQLYRDLGNKQTPAQGGSTFVFTNTPDVAHFGPGMGPVNQQASTAQGAFRQDFRSSSSYAASAQQQPGPYDNHQDSRPYHSTGQRPAQYHSFPPNANSPHRTGRTKDGSFWKDTNTNYTPNFNNFPRKTRFGPIASGVQRGNDGSYRTYERQSRYHSEGEHDGYDRPRRHSSAKDPDLVPNERYRKDYRRHHSAREYGTHPLDRNEYGERPDNRPTARIQEAGIDGEPFEQTEERPQNALILHPTHSTTPAEKATSPSPSDSTSIIDVTAIDEATATVEAPAQRPQRRVPDVEMRDEVAGEDTCLVQYNAKIASMRDADLNGNPWEGSGSMRFSSNSS